MSKWSGKCDFCDDVEMFSTPEEFVKTARVYLKGGLLDTSTPQKLVPYYTYIASTKAGSKDGWTMTLMNESWINIEEKQFISHRVIEAITWARKAKKEKSDFTFDYCKKQKYYYESQPELLKAIVARINEKPDIIKIHISKNFREACNFIESWVIPNYFYDIHDSMHNRYREEFIKFAKKNGYAVFLPEDNFVTTNGEYSPIIYGMCRSVSEYYKMAEKYSGE